MAITTTADVYLSSDDILAQYTDGMTQTKMNVAQIMEDWYSAALENAKPFEETSDFRDFIVWLCGYTDRSDPPPAEEWQKLQERVKKVAAKFATDVHDRALKEAKHRANQARIESYYDQLSQKTVTTLSDSSGTTVALSTK